MIPLSEISTCTSTVFVGIVVAADPSANAAAAAASMRTRRPTLSRIARSSDDVERAVERLALVERAAVGEVPAHHRGGEEMRLPTRLDRLRLLPEDREVVHLLAAVH